MRLKDIDIVLDFVIMEMLGGMKWVNYPLFLDNFIAQLHIKN